MKCEDHKITGEGSICLAFGIVLLSHALCRPGPASNPVANSSCGKPCTARLTDQQEDWQRNAFAAQAKETLIALTQTGNSKDRGMSWEKEIYTGTSFMCVSSELDVRVIHRIP